MRRQRKYDDPKRAAARRELDEAQAWVDILCKGIGYALATNYHDDAGPVRMLVARVNGELTEALERLELATKAYEPFWRSRLVSVRRRKNPKSKKAA